MHNRVLVKLFVVLVLAGCSKDGVDDRIYHNRESGTPLNGLRIAWDYSSMKKLAPQGGYARLLRLADQSIIVITEDYLGNAFLIRSYDEGDTWTDPFAVFTQKTINSTVVNMANPEIIQLANGDILVACNYRPKAGDPRHLQLRYGKAPITVKLGQKTK